MIGPRGGTRGMRVGIAAGIGADPLGPSVVTSMAGVSRDATSNIYCPATAGEWATTFAVAGIAASVTSIYLCQEASGNLADSGPGAVTLTAAGASLVYQQAVTGWTRTAFATPDAAANHNAQNTTTAVDLSTTSAIFLLYLRMPTAAPAATRRIARINSVGISAGINTTPVLTCVTGGVGGSTVNGTSSPLNRVGFVLHMVDKTNNRVRVCTDQDKIVGTQGTYATVALGFGSSGSTAGDFGWLYGAVMTAGSAELTDAQLKTLLQTLGWTIPWT